MIAPLVVWLALCVPGAPSQPVRLQPYPQAAASFHAAPPAGLAWSLGPVTASDGAVWRAAERGLWREDPRAAPADHIRYFASRRWLPADRVLALAPGASGSMWVRTAAGPSHILFRRMTLAGKAAHFEQRIEQRHNRFGMVASSSLGEPGNLTSNRTGTTDNDGLWTAMYGAAECLRYAVTRSPEALRLARRSTDAVLELERVTGVAGLPARSLLLLSEPRPPDGVWHLSRDGSRLWKADTSSDEIAGHYLQFALAFDHLPDPGLRRRVQEVARRMTDYILDGGLTLRDIHGMPTWWGRWDEEYFASSRGKPDSPLNALEILSFLKTAHHITGEARYQREYLRLALDRGYARTTTRYRELRGPAVNYSDEELAMLSFYPLLRYEKDPRLLAVYRQALEDWWINMPRQKNPLWTFIYLSGQPAAKASLDGAVWTLQRIPMDLVTWTVRNSDRTDIEWEPAVGRFGERQSRTLLPADERPVMKWNGNPFRVDGGNGGAGEDDGAFFLLPYWMGRYHRFLTGE